MVRADSWQTVEAGDSPPRVLTPRDHACLIHSGVDGQIDALAAFLQGGLDGGEHCVCILERSTSERLRSLAGDGALESARATGSLELHDASALPADGAGVARTLRELASPGRPLRVVVEQTRLLSRAGVVAALRREAAMDEFVQERPACVLCCYDRSSAPAESLIELLHAHRLIVQDGELRANPAHVPPRELLRSARAERRLASLLAAAEPIGSADGGGLSGRTSKEPAPVRGASEQAQAFRALRETSRRFQTVLESVQDVAYKLHLERGTFSYVSPSVERLLGFTPAQLVAMGVRGTYRLVHPEDAHRLRENTRSLLEATDRHDVDPEIEFRMRRRDGDYVWVCDSRRVVRDAMGAPWAIVGIVRDVSARKRAQAALQESGTEVDRILRYIPERIFVKDRDLTFIYANESFAEDLGMRPCEVVGKSDHDIFPEQMARQCRADDRRVLEAGEPVVQENAWVDSETGRHRRQEWTKIPIKDSRGEALALVGVAGWTGERSQAERMLSHWASLIVSAADAIVGVTLDGVILSWNSGAGHIYGYAPEEVLGSSVSRLAPGGAAAELLERIQRVSQGDTVRGYETDHVTSDGRTVAVSLTIAPLLGPEGAVVGASVTARDITERKRAQEALREQERALATLMRNLPGMAYRCRNDPQWTMEFLSEGCLRLTGYHPSALLQNQEVTYADLIHPDDRDEVWQEVQRGVAGKQPFRLTYRIRTADGDERWVWEQGRAVFSRDGEVVALEGFITDITERRRAQEQLRESRERYRELWDDAPVAYHMLDTEGIIQRVNKTELSMLGYEEEEMVGRPIFDFIPPEQREEARRRFSQKIRSEDVPKAQNRAYVRRDGSMIYVSIDDVLERDAQGNVTGVRTTMVDVTEQVRLREELRSMSLEDELTGLRNRRGFQHLASQQMKVAERAGYEMLLVFADVDGMKWINDTYGHPEGDRALVAAAGVLRETFRGSDILARVGGDEFAVLAIEAGGDSEADVRARLRECLDARNSAPERRYDLALSLGIAHYDPANPVCLDELMSTADTLMYREKREREGARLRQ